MPNIEQLSKANKEIEELKLILSVSDARINRLVDENNEMKAQVNALRDHTSRYMYRVEARGREPVKSIEDLLAKTPQQCLANVRADAIESAAKEWHESCVDEVSGLAVRKELMCQANKLREQK